MEGKTQPINSHPGNLRASHGVLIILMMSIVTTVCAQDNTDYESISICCQSGSGEYRSKELQDQCVLCPDDFFLSEDMCGFEYPPCRPCDLHPGSYKIVKHPCSTTADTQFDCEARRYKSYTSNKVNVFDCHKCKYCSGINEFDATPCSYKCCDQPGMVIVDDRCQHQKTDAGSEEGDERIEENEIKRNSEEIRPDGEDGNGIDEDSENEYGTLNSEKGYDKDEDFENEYGTQNKEKETVMDKHKVIAKDEGEKSEKLPPTCIEAPRFSETKFCTAMSILCAILFVFVCILSAYVVHLKRNARGKYE